MSNVIVVFSDLHANSGALRAAVADAESCGFDQVVVLGDLLTYGLDQREVLDIVAELQDRRGAVVILGNHDQLYLDLAQGDQRYFDSLPQWLKETVEHTARTLDARAFRERYAWRQSHEIEQCLFAHANPWSYGDWRYINHESDAREAAVTLRERGFRYGVFGHTHRRMALAFGGQPTTPKSLGDRWNLDAASEATTVVNAGSIGQPRHSDGLSTYLRLEQHATGTRGELRAVRYDVSAHLAALQSCALSAATRDKLCGFFSSSR